MLCILFSEHMKQAVTIIKFIIPENGNNQNRNPRKETYSIQPIHFSWSSRWAWRTWGSLRNVTRDNTWFQNEVKNLT